MRCPVLAMRCAVLPLSVLYSQAILDAFNPNSPDLFDAAGNGVAVAPMPYLAYQQVIALRACYAMPGTGVPYRVATMLYVAYQQVIALRVASTDLAYGAIALRACASGTKASFLFYCCGVLYCVWL
eukprot:69807-Rhodomonas_salina.1